MTTRLDDKHQRSDIGVILRCDLSGNSPEPHNISRDLKLDPLKRTVTKDGQTRTMKLCHACYHKARGEKAKENGERCDLSDNSPGLHNITLRGLTADPLKRTVTKDGQTRTMKLCTACYHKALGEKAKENGRRCDLSGNSPGPHNISSQSLTTDPLKRKVTEEDGKERVMKLCFACYQQALRQRKKNSEALGVDPSESTVRQRKKKAPPPPDEQIVEAPEEPVEALSPIKPEPYSGDDECRIEKEGRCKRQFDDSLPILQDPKNPKLSLLSAAEGPIEKLICANWDRFADLSSKEKRQITEEVREWVRLNEYDRETYQEKLDSLLEVSIPVDEGPNRGSSVFAKQKINQYQVVCPYAGVLHRTEESMINTSQLHNEPAFKENNLAPVIFGKNVVVYVALRDIEPGEELLMDYGPSYDSLQIWKEVKQEEELEHSAMQ
jgi:hypothetical protein